MSTPLFLVNIKCPPPTFGQYEMALTINDTSYNIHSTVTQERLNTYAEINRAD